MKITAVLKQRVSELAIPMFLLFNWSHSTNLFSNLNILSHGVYYIYFLSKNIFMIKWTLCFFIFMWRYTCLMQKQSLECNQSKKVLLKFLKNSQCVGVSFLIKLQQTSVLHFHKILLKSTKTSLMEHHALCYLHYVGLRPENYDFATVTSAFCFGLNKSSMFWMMNKITRRLKIEPCKLKKHW